ncbi:MAG: hypothetical protein FWE68_00140 [Defluviitaleaceae bacterium]|nr:hypothetical protein [Defluviitaleaceae bacterium]
MPNAIQQYFRRRRSLIDQYLKGDMTKGEYLDRNLDAVLDLRSEPFKNIDSVEKGLFNYQYFNAMAKDARAEAFLYSEREMKKESTEIANYYYYKKDRATLAVLRLIDYKGVTAYFIAVRSKYLRGRLFEIVLEDHDMILHSASEVILNQLREENVFTEGVRTSVIDYYVNQRYDL